jgi:peptide/nickel transport system permease protein
MMAGSSMRRIGVAMIGLIALAAVAAPVLSPHGAGARFNDRLFAPPMRPHVVGPDGRWRRPFIYPLRLVDRLERRFEEDRAHPVPLAWFSGGTLVRAADEARGPWLPLGGDSFGRDVFAQLLYGARTSLGLAAVAAVGALAIGLLVGGFAGYRGGWPDEGLMRFAEFVLVLPTTYVVLALRAVMPLVLPASAVFLLMSGIFALVGWPYVARGVRAIVASERQRDYAVAARAAGASHARILVRHLLPAARGFLATQATLLLPAFILAEATLSYVGLGFAEPTASWGAMLHEAANVTAIADCPWTLSPAAAIFLAILAVNLSVQSAGRTPASS